MRLFNRRKDLQNGATPFDDPRLVGMSPLKTIDETNKASDLLRDSMVMTESMENVYYLDEDKSESLVFRRSNHVQRSSSFMAPSSVSITGGKRPFQTQHVPMYLPHQLQKEVPVRKNVGGNSLSSWSRRVSDTWDNIRRSESTEGFFSSTGTLNRRKTLHIHQPAAPSDQQQPESLRSSMSTSRLAEKVLAYREKFQTLRNSSTKTDQKSVDMDTISKASTPGTPRKLGRVQSLRLLLSRGKKNGSSVKSIAPGVKVDKETDTEDLDSIYGSCTAVGGEEVQEDNELVQINSTARSLYQAYSSSATQIPTGSTYDPFPEEYYSLSSPTTASSCDRQRRCSLADGCENGNDYASFDPYFLMMKTTSCDNLSSITSNTNGGSKYTNELHKSTSTDTVITTSSSKSSSSGSSSAKRSSFPYAYIRSKLTALPEEPQNQIPGSPREQPEEIRKVPPRRTQSHRNLATGGQGHSSLGDLYSTRSTVSREKNTIQDEEYGVEEILHQPLQSMPYTSGPSSSSGFEPRRRPCSIACPPGEGQKLFESGLVEPTEEDDHFDKISLNSSSGGESNNSPRIWDGINASGSQRSFSIGDMRNNNNHGNQHQHGSSTEVSSSGYDSDSTRNTGNESPRLSMAVAANKPSGPASRMISNHRRSFDTVSTLSSGVVDSSSSSGASSPTHSAGCELPSSVSSTNYGPLAYVTLTRKPDMRRNKPINSTTSNSVTEDLLHRSRNMSNSSGIISFTSSGTLESKVLSSTLPRRSQSSSCISTSSLLSKAPSSSKNSGSVVAHLPIPPSAMRRQRKGSMDSSGAGDIISHIGDGYIPRSRDRSRTQSLCLSIFSVKFEKGPTKKSLGFSVVGGKDSPKGSMGIFIKRIFPYGQASEEGNITEGKKLAI